MKNNDWKDRLNVVYSTNPDFRYETEETEESDTLLKEKQTLRVQLDKRNRGGKQVTLITGFTGKSEDLEALGKLLKTKCGVGGSTKDNEIIIQGDFRNKIVEILHKEGYVRAKLWIMNYKLWIMDYKLWINSYFFFIFANGRTTSIQTWKFIKNDVKLFLSFLSY